MVCLSVILLCYRITCLWFCNKKGALFVPDPVYLSKKLILYFKAFTQRNPWARWKLEWQILPNIQGGSNINSKQTLLENAVRGKYFPIHSMMPATPWYKNERHYKKLNHRTIPLMNRHKNPQQPWLVWFSGLTECQPANQKVSKFDSQSGHMPGLQARSSVGGVQEATVSHKTFLSLPLSLHSSHSKNK